MIKVRLQALEHPAPDEIDITNRESFASTILWLEDFKIHHYKVEDRADLRKVDDLNEWEKAYEKYKKDIGIPKFNTPSEELCWFLSYAVRLKYLKTKVKYGNINSDEVQKLNAKPKTLCVQAENSFDLIDFHEEEFINGVRTLADKFDIPYHPNHLIQLEAIKRIIVKRLSKKEGKGERPVQVEDQAFPFEILGDDILCEDEKVDYPAKILRLLQIQSLRQLQTKIDECIASVQEITANPKIIQKLVFTNSNYYRKSVRK